MLADNVIIVIITALISGLIATIITICWQRRTSIRNKKMTIFEILMAHRYRISTRECVHALNSVEVIFYKDKAVRNAYAIFLHEVDIKDNAHKIQDAHLKLLEEMAKVLKLKNIHWDDIKHYYYPVGLAEQNREEEYLRKLQVQNALDTATRNNQQNTNPDLISDQQMVFSVLPELMKNPESLKMILEYAQKHKTNNIE